MRLRLLTLGAVAVFVALTLSACASADVIRSAVPPSTSQAVPQPERSTTAGHPSSTPAPARTPASWAAAPTDGTWAYGDVSLGQPITATSSRYRVTVTGTPTFTTLEGTSITMTSPLLIEVWKDGGFGGGPSVFWQPGVTPESEVYDETYGTATKLHCDNEAVLAEEPVTGQQSACTVSFAASAAEMTNAFWVIESRNAAAWPSQRP